MRFLTVRRPWAFPMFRVDTAGLGRKTVENRTYLPGHGVERIGIHQGLAIDRAGLEMLGGYTPTRQEELSAGHIIGSVRILSAHVARSEECACAGDPWAFWPTAETPRIVHWMLVDPRFLESPIAAVGKLQLWEGTVRESHLTAAGPFLEDVTW